MKPWLYFAAWELFVLITFTGGHCAVSGGFDRDGEDYSCIAAPWTAHTVYRVLMIGAVIAAAYHVGRLVQRGSASSKVCWRVSTRAR